MKPEGKREDGRTGERGTANGGRGTGENGRYRRDDTRQDMPAGVPAGVINTSCGALLTAPARGGAARGRSRDLGVTWHPRQLRMLVRGTGAGATASHDRVCGIGRGPACERAGFSRY